MVKVKELDEAQRKLELWFFRDLFDEHRLALFSLFGLPVDEIGKNHGHQRKALLDVLSALSPSPAPDMREAVEALRMVEEWWLTEGMHEPGRIGAPAAIFKARAALRSLTGAKP